MNRSGALSLGADVLGEKSPRQFIDSDCRSLPPTFFYGVTTVTHIGQNCLSQPPRLLRRQMSESTDREKALPACYAIPDEKRLCPRWLDPKPVPFSVLSQTI